MNAISDIIMPHLPKERWGIEPSLSALVVVRNEEAQLADCLLCLDFADEIVVVLDRCTDRSRQIAEHFGARILEGAWELEGPRRMEGIARCSGQWILEVDADERVSPGLAAEIRATIRSGSASYYFVPIDNYIGDRLVRHGWGCSWGVTATVRLFARGAKHWGDQHVHPKVTYKGDGGWLSTPMAHYVDRNISDMIARFDRYTTLRALDLRASQEIGDLPHNIRRIFSRFYKCYVRRKGYREGLYGFLIALMAGLFPLMSFLKARLEES